LDAGGGQSMPDRVARLAADFFDHAAWLSRNGRNNESLNIDIVGFSRGAASARIFANLLGAFLDGEDSFVLDRSSGRRVDFTVGDPRFARNYFKSACVNVALRFLGLWDTVPHYYLSQEDDLAQLDLAIDTEIKHVAHAVAVNEDRKDFHAISIHSSPFNSVGVQSSFSANRNTESRMELGFLGAHSDIGGGYSEGDLSDVALMWMVQRAEEAGVKINREYMSDSGRRWTTVDAPIVHDSVGTRVENTPYFFGSGRYFKYMNGVDSTPQKSWSGYGLDYRTSQEGFYDRRYEDEGSANYVATANPTLVGAVDGQKYSDWLANNYGVSIEIDTSRLKDGSSSDGP
jgi:hypothetical protein